MSTSQDAVGEFIARCERATIRQLLGADSTDELKRQVGRDVTCYEREDGERTVFRGVAEGEDVHARIEIGSQHVFAREDMR